MIGLTELAALALEPREREIVLGDLAERGTSGGRAFFEVLGLAVRRQLLIWTDWRPWFGLIGIAGVSGFYLSLLHARLTIGLFAQISAWRHYGVHYNVGVTGFRADVIRMCCLAAAIFCWTAVNVSVLRRFSRRALWLTGLFFYVVVHSAAAARAVLSGAVAVRGDLPWWTAFGPVLPPDFASACLFLFLFVIPAICGARSRLPGIVPLTVIFTIAVALLGEYHAHDLERLSGGAFRAAAWPAIIAPYLLVSWPVCLVRRARSA